MPSEPPGSSVDHSTLPFARSYARSCRSWAVATNTSPPAVTSGAPRGKCAPESAGKPGPGVVPSGTRHLISPVFKSYAVSSENGGPKAPMPFVGLRKKSYGTE